MTKVLVTGSSGFLGTEIVRLALQKGYEVVGVDLRSPDSFPPDNFEFIKSSLLNIDKTRFTKIDFVIHAASSLPYGNSKLDFAQNNVEAARKVANLALDLDAFLVEVSSSSVYGRPSSVPISAETKTSPLDDYGYSKLVAEKEILKVLPKAKVCIIRPRTILGAGRTGIFSKFFSLIRSGKPLPLPNAGSQIIQFVHVEDLAALCLFMGEREFSGTWPAASPKPRRLLDHLQEISRNENLTIRYIPLNASFFELIGKILVMLKLTSFTKWHFGAFPYDSYFDEIWIPNGFVYERTSSEAFLDTWRSSNSSSASIYKATKWKLGRKV